MSERIYDIVIIGSGPGGYVAAVRAGQLGMTVAVVEAGPLGGVCLNIGCIPTKALLHSADLLEETREAKRFGVMIPEVTFDLTIAMRHKQTVIKQSTEGVAYLMKKNRVDVIAGWATVAGRGQVHVRLNAGGEQLLQAKHIIVATGGKPMTLPGIEFDEERILSSTGMLELKAVPKSLVVIGAGAIGVEFASMCRSFGSEVTIIEALPRLLPREDEEISAEVTKVFQRRGIKSVLGATLLGVEKVEAGIIAVLTDSSGKEQRISAEKLLLGISITPRTKDIGLEAAGVTMNGRGFIEIDGMMRTRAEGIYAIGDCIPTPWLAHVASAEGLLAVEHIAGQNVHAIDYDHVVGCTYCNPEVASVGLTEARAKEQGYAVKVGKFPFSANGKARILGQSRFGLIKLVADKQYDQILGVHMVGPHVTEMISEGGLALSHEATGESMLQTIHAHPTLYEAIGEAAHALVHGSAIHI